MKDLERDIFPSRGNGESTESYEIVWKVYEEVGHRMKMYEDRMNAV